MKHPSSTGGGGGGADISWNSPIIAHVPGFNIDRNIDNLSADIISTTYLLRFSWTIK